MAPKTDTAGSLKRRVAQSLASAPIVGVVRTSTYEEAEQQARAFIAGGLEIIEITFTVPGAAALIRQLLQERGADGPPWIGAGTVTDHRRASQALTSGAEFLVTPNVSSEVAAIAREAGVFLVLGALTATEICAARTLGADLVKVYPLPPVGGPGYLAVITQPLDDVPILAAGGFGAPEIPAYREAGAVAFGIGAQLLGSGDAQSQRQRIASALAAARGDR